MVRTSRGEPQRSTRNPATRCSAMYQSPTVDAGAQTVFAALLPVMTAALAGFVTRRCASGTAFARQ